VTRRRVASVSLALGATFGGAGCIGDETSTCQVPSDDMSIVGKVIDAGSSIRAEIDFEAGDRSGIDRPLELCEDDRLEINGEEPTETRRPGRIVYAVTFPADMTQIDASGLHLYPGFINANSVLGLVEIESIRGTSNEWPDRRRTSRTFDDGKKPSNLAPSDN